MRDELRDVITERDATIAALAARIAELEVALNLEVSQWTAGFDTGFATLQPMLKSAQAKIAELETQLADAQADAKNLADSNRELTERFLRRRPVATVDHAPSA